MRLRLVLLVKREESRTGAVSQDGFVVFKFSYVKGRTFMIRQVHDCKCGGLIQQFHTIGSRGGSVSAVCRGCCGGNLDLGSGGNLQLLLCCT